MTRLGYTSRTLDMLKKEGNVVDTKIYVLNPEYVTRKVQEDSDGLLSC